MFLTLEDPRAQIKGSRDPLGVQTLWSGFGRHVVFNLTTVTNSLRSFTVLLIGRHLAEILAEREEIGEEEVLEVFLRWEQVAGYARHILHGVEGDIRGITRIKAHVREGKGKVPIGIAGEDQILADQRIYGIWGLYTAAARTSGLLPEGLLGVSEPARAFLESHALRRIDRQIGPLLDVVRENGSLSTDRRNVLLRAVASALDPKLTDVEMTFYAEWLRDALGVRDPLRTGVATGRQTLLSRLMREHLDLKEIVGREAVLRLAASAHAVDEGLARALERIVDLEALLAPAEALFEHVLARPGQTAAAVAGEVRKQWGTALPNLEAERFELLLPEIRERAGAEVAATVEATHRALRTGAYVDAIEHILAWNAVVMGSRGGPPWATVQKGRLDVRLSAYEASLPDGSKLPSYWRNSYFLDSLRWITHQIEERRA